MCVLRTVGGSTARRTRLLPAAARCCGRDTVKRWTAGAVEPPPPPMLQLLLLLHEEGDAGAGAGNARVAVGARTTEGATKRHAPPPRRLLLLKPAAAAATEPISPTRRRRRSGSHAWLLFQAAAAGLLRRMLRKGRVSISICWGPHTRGTKVNRQRGGRLLLDTSSPLWKPRRGMALSVRAIGSKGVRPC